MKEQQRFWTVVPSGFQELEVRKAYLFLNKEPDEGLDHCYSQEMWFEAYQFIIKPVYGSNIWKRQPNQPLLPHIVKRMPDKPKKYRVKAMSENNSQEPMSKPPHMKKHPGRKTEPNYLSDASNRGGGRGYREGRGDAIYGRGEASGGRGKASGGIGEESGGIGKASGDTGQASGGRGQSNAARFQANTERAESSGGRGRAKRRGGRSGRAKGRGGRGQGRGGRGRGRGGTKMLVDEHKMSEDKIRKNIEHEYMEQLYNHILTPQKYASTSFEGGIAYVQTQESIADRGEPSWRLNEDALAEPPNLKKQGRKRKVAEPSAAESQFRIYHKNRGTSERIFNQKMKKTGFGPNVEWSTADKTLSL
nr:hypothetical protein [Tanacetum cinerariifolium]